MNGILVTNREGKKKQGKRTATLGIQFVNLQSNNAVSRISATVKSVSARLDKKNPPNVDDEGNIVGHGIGYIESDAIICTVLTQVGPTSKPN
jgi:hypothetical protein